MTAPTTRREALLADLRAVAVPWLLVRALVVAGFLTAYSAVDRLTPGVRTTAMHDGLLAWDGTWYRDIAEFGYRAVSPEGLRFFPGYPLVGRALGWLLLGHDGWALVLVANLCAIAVAVLVRRLVLAESGDLRWADRSVWVVCLFPGAFVLAWGYAEAMFLVCALGAFLAMRRQAWWWAALAGAIAGFTRPLGVLLVAPLVIELVRTWRGSTRSSRASGVVAVIAPLAGTGVYMAWVGHVFGDAWLPYTVQNSLRGASSDPFSRLWHGLGQLLGPDRMSDGLHVLFAVAFVVLLVFVFRVLPVSYGAFAALVLVAALDADNLNSLERYGLNAFPLALALAWLARDERVERVVTPVLAAGMLALCALAWCGAYVP